METEVKPKKQGIWTPILKFIPLIVFAALVIVFKLDLLIAAPFATFAAAAVYMITERCRFEKAFSRGLKAASNITLVFFILMFAYGVAECFMATGVGAALINLALRLGVTARTIAPAAILVTCLLSVATGSSWGTFAACAPIFLWMNHLVGGDVLLTVCAIAGGACFGDNIGMISDVTVLSCGMQDVKIIDRVKHQSVWSILCLMISMAVFYFAGRDLPTVRVDVEQVFAQIPQDSFDALAEQRPSAWQLLQQVRTGVPYYMIVPMLVVIVLSFLGTHTLLCLGAGMVSSLLLGLLAGTISISDWLSDMLLKGFGDAGSWTVVMMMWVAAFGGIMNAMNAFDPLAKLVVKISRNVHQLMGWCGLLCLVGNMALADEAAQVATMSPIVRDIVEKNVDCETEDDAYKLRLRLATYTSSMGIYGSELVPWHCFPVFFAAIANAVYPMYHFTSFDIISKNYMSFIVIGSILILSFTGWDRIIPMFGLPKNVKLRKAKKQTEG
ncbi:MAG: Na+/H+ antiporter NhaC family protein [Oscillospiraceae bacterium]|nr:Na+/H+ antiporter NhaC family protein [Oscillospiraceae bacterium]